MSGNSGKIVVLARGLGTRMRKASDAILSQKQAAMADSGIKALVPIDRPFLDYVLTAAADAGWRDVCLIIGPEHQAIRDYYQSLDCRRIRISFAIQQEPRGTADAVAAAADFTANDDFLCINSDNFYPAEALESLHQASGMALAAFDADGMLRGSNIPADRLKRFAVLQLRPDGTLQRIIEKPSDEQLAALARPHYLSMNCWRFTPAIYAACRAIKPSVRGELEITDAVQHAAEQPGERFTALPCNKPVLDLSFREDISPVARLLSGKNVNL